MLHLTLQGHLHLHNPWEISSTQKLSGRTQVCRRAEEAGGHPCGASGLGMLESFDMLHGFKE